MTRKQRLFIRRQRKTAIIIIIGLIFGIWFGIVIFNKNEEPGLIIQKKAPIPTNTPTQTPIMPIKGVASYYSRSHCLGCSDTLTMANGDVLDDTKLTVAYNHAPLNTFVTIENINNGKTVTAKITDRGGFERHGRIVDLSVATKEAIDCTDLCTIALEF